MGPMPLAQTHQLRISNRTNALPSEFTHMIFLLGKSINTLVYHQKGQFTYSRQGCTIEEGKLKKFRNVGPKTGASRLSLIMQLSL